MIKVKNNKKDNKGDGKFIYSQIWWQANSDYDDEAFEKIIEEHIEDGWEIFKMFLVYPGKKEGYRIIFRKHK